MDPATVAASGSDYAELKRRVSRAGLFERQPLYYALKLAVTLGLLVLGLLLLIASSSLVIDLAVAAFLGIVGGQIGFVLHDTAHRQIFPPGRRADALQMLSGPLLLGVGGSWWKRKHDLHHAHPNHEQLDPDTNIRLLAFTQDQARAKSRWVALVTRYQAYLIFPLLMFEGFQLRAAGLKHLLTARPRYHRLEVALVLLHVAGLYALFVVLVGWPGALAAIFVREAVFGVYVGSVFAPNHKGMPMVGPGSKLTFLEQQVLTARNVRGGRVVDWWYGGLNYQIEHHLFPTLPRNRLREAQGLVKSFCAERRVPYYETSLWNSYRELFRSLDTASSPLKSANA